MFPISMLKFTDKFEFNKAISINNGGANIKGGTYINDSFTLNSNIAANLGKGFTERTKLIGYMQPGLGM